MVSAVLVVPMAIAQSASETPKTPMPSQRQWTGDLDALLKHRTVRIGVPYSKTFFYSVKGAEYGITYDTGSEFQIYLNRKYPQSNKNIKIHVFFVVTPRDKAVSYLDGGTVDILAGGLTITPERQKLVDFSEAIYKDINEIVVTGPSAPKISSPDELSGREVFVRKTSAYWEHLQSVNERLQKDKKAPVKIALVPDDLADEDILEMVNAGLLPTTVVNERTARLWAKLLPKIQVHSDIVIGPDVAFAWAVRKNSPQLLATIDDFLKTHRQGTQFGNQIVNKYITSTYMLKQATSPEGMKRFDQTAQTFRKYADKYGADYLLMMAEGYQESGLNQQVKSKVGAVGVMQLMPATGKEMNVGDITQEEANIHAGIKYFNATKDRLYANEPMDNVNKILFTFAAYNCGPARVKQLRAEAEQKGLDPNVWLNNVEFIAAARVGQETVNYVSNIYKYYVAYKLIAVQEEQRRKAEQSIQKKQ